MHQYRTRNAEYIHVPLVFSVRFYNRLPSNISLEENSEKLKKAMKDFLLEKAYYSVEELFEA